MKILILLTTFALAWQLAKGGAVGVNPPYPVATVTCNDDHTVDLNIEKVDDLDEWISADWQLDGKASCGPSLFFGTTVTYTGLYLPDCALSQEQLSDGIKYVLKIDVTKPNPGFTGQLRAYDHLYYVSCTYDNQNRSSASFVPIVNRNDNDSSNAYFTFELQAFSDYGYSSAVPKPVALDLTVYFRARVVTSSNDPNLDLFPVLCWSSQSADPGSYVGMFTLIENGCGNDTVSDDLGDTLSYTCTNNSIQEDFSLNTYRYFGQPEGSTVYIHCEFRVCLAEVPNSMCECPDPLVCTNSAMRKRRSLDGIVDETEVYRVTSGPYTFEKAEEEEEVNKEEGKTDEQGEPQSFPTNVAIIVAVCGVVAVAIICATVFLVVRSRNKRRQNDGDVNVVT